MIVPICFLYIILSFTQVCAQSLFEEAIQAGKKNSFEINGYVRGTFFGGKVPDTLKPQTKAAFAEAALKMNATKSSYGKAYAEVLFMSGYEADSGFSSFDIREAYGAVFFKPLDIYIGKQIIVWGRADAINPTNCITPQKLYSHTSHEDERRRGNFLVRSQFTYSPFRFEVLWIPLYAANEIGMKNDMLLRVIAPTASSPIIIQNRVRQFPNASMSNSSVASKLTFQTPSADGSVSYFNGYSLTPGIDITSTLNSQGIPVITPIFKAYRIHMLGADFAATIGSIMGIRGEYAFRTCFEDHQKYVYLPNPEFQYVLGIDKTMNNFSFILQYSGSYILDFGQLEEPSNPLLMQQYKLETINRTINRQLDQFTHGLMFRPALHLFHETVLAEIATLYLFATKELMLGPKVEYQITDALSAAIGGSVYTGVKGSLFDSIEEQASAGFVELKASF